MTEITNLGDLRRFVERLSLLKDDVKVTPCLDCVGPEALAERKVNGAILAMQTPNGIELQLQEDGE